MTRTNTMFPDVLFSRSPTAVPSSARYDVTVSDLAGRVLWAGKADFEPKVQDGILQLMVDKVSMWFAAGAWGRVTSERAQS